MERRGYQIKDMDSDSTGYDIDAVKGGRRLDLQVDQNCKILQERPD